MRPLLNAPDTRLTTLQTEEEEDSNVYCYSGGDDPEDATEYDTLLKHRQVCMCTCVCVCVCLYVCVCVCILY